MYGIKAIAVVTDDGATSSWAGEPRDLPRWHPVESGGISAVKAKLDVRFFCFFPLLSSGTDHVAYYP